jgi:hypothetical protein
MADGRKRQGSILALRRRGFRHEPETLPRARPGFQTGGEEPAEFHHQHRGYNPGGGTRLKIKDEGRRLKAEGGRMGKKVKLVKGQGFPKILPEIRAIIEQSRNHVAYTANLSLVNLYWNIGRIVTQDIQKNEKRAGYGEQLLGGLAKVLTQEYGQGYSTSNLNDFRRFYEAFQILQTVSVKSLEKEIDQTPSDELGKEICQTLSNNSTDGRILQTLSAESYSFIVAYTAW